MAFNKLDEKHKLPIKRFEYQSKFQENIYMFKVKDKETEQGLGQNVSSVFNVNFEEIFAQ